MFGISGTLVGTKLSIQAQQLVMLVGELCLYTMSMSPCFLCNVLKKSKRRIRRKASGMEHAEALETPASHNT
jgi:hypothetical protein